MQKILAMAGLTWKAAMRFRLFLVISVLLLAAVVGLPMVLKSDGTARGLTQIILTYTLSAITALLGFSTLWLSCGVLARDVEECQIQVVATKPIARWQIWLGKWLGILSLNATFLVLSGGCVFGLLQWRAARLPLAQQKILRQQVLVARGVVKPPNLDSRIDAETQSIFQKRLKSNPGLARSADLPAVIKQIREEVQAVYQVVPPGYTRQWQIDLGFAKNFLHDKPLQLRIKFDSATEVWSKSGTYIGLWQIGDPQTGRVWQSEPMSLAPDTYHEITIPPNLFDKQGLLTIAFQNQNNTALLFPLSDGMEVLYPEGGFAMNFARGLAIIFCWLALLAALGLAAASFLSFPVAAFFAMTVLTMVLSSGTLTDVVKNGTIGVLGTPSEHSVLNPVLLPLFKGILTVVNLAENFSPIDAVSTGRAIPWTELGLAFGQIVLLLGGIVSIIGIALFHRRELATAQGTQ